MVASAPPVHLIIRLPYNRADVPLPDPPAIQWNAEKENMLWEVIARSRAADSAGTDWPALSAHLQVPLPYLLYRAQVRYEEDLRGIQDIRSTLGVSSSAAVRTDISRADERPSSGINAARTSSLHTWSKDKISRSILDLPGKARPSSVNRRVPTPSISEPSESDEDAEIEEAETRRLEEQEKVGQRLKELEKMMSSELLDFARPTPRARAGPSLNLVQPRSPLRDSIRHGDITSSSESPATSPQESIPSIPSLPPEPRSQTSSQLSSQAAATLQPNPSSASMKGHSLQPHSPRRGLAVKQINSHRGSSQGSAASSFSDLSDVPSVSASALESALMSNIRGAGSRFSLFARSHLGGRGNMGL